MTNLNKVQLIGRIGQDAKTIKSGNAASFSMATTEKYKDKSGEKMERTEWHNIMVYGKLAEFAVSYAKKGRLVYVEGKIQSNKKDDKTYYGIIANSFQLLDRTDNGAYQETKSSPVTNTASNDDVFYDDQEIPF